MPSRQDMNWAYSTAPRVHTEHTMTYEQQSLQLCHKYTENYNSRKLTKTVHIKCIYCTLLSEQKKTLHAADSQTTQHSQPEYQ